jgi:hypothetical protein
LVIGIGMLAEGSSSGAVEALSIGIPILAVMGLLFWFAFSRRQPPPGTGTTSA